MISDKILSSLWTEIGNRKWRAHLLPPPCLCRCLGSRQFGPWKNTLSRYYNQNMNLWVY